MIRRISQRVSALWGWRRLLLAMIAGGLSALAMAPYDAVPILLVTIPVLIWLLDGVLPSGSEQRGGILWPAFLIGWAFGFGYFLVGLWWIGGAFLVESDRFGWLLPLAAIAMPTGLAIFHGVAAVLARMFWRADPFRLLVFVASFAGVELLRGYIFTGFPWNAFGMIFAASDVTMQSASLLGVHGLTILALFLAGFPVVLDGSDPSAGLARWRLRFQKGILILFALVIAGGTIGYGLQRMTIEVASPETPMRLRIIQPNIPQKEKWAEDLASRNFSRLIEMSDRATSPDASGAADRDLIIWPESAMPFYYQDQQGARAAISAVIPDGTFLATGYLHYRQNADTARGFDVFNAIGVINSDGDIISSYDKVRLVPFGEFLPFQEMLENWGIRQLTGLPGGFIAGTDSSPVRLPGGQSFIPTVCYEAIFPGLLTIEKAQSDRPDFILNVTNDAWYGDTPGPRQHLRQARMRAVEEGLPLVRSANTGISAMIDAKGRIVTALPLGVEGVIDAELPGQFGVTPFQLSRGWAAPLLLLGIIIFAFLAKIPPRSRISREG